MKKGGWGKLGGILQFPINYLGIRQEPLAPDLPERQAETYRSWIHQNSERTEFW